MLTYTTTLTNKTTQTILADAAKIPLCCPFPSRQCPCTPALLSPQRFTTNTTKCTGRFDVIEVDAGEGEQPFFRLVIAILVYGNKDSPQGCELLCVDLRQVEKVGHENLLVQSLFEIHTIPRSNNGLYWSLNSVESIMRPVCFIPTVETINQYNNWCTKPLHPDFRPFSLHFRAFMFYYCDRSHWNSITRAEDEYQAMGNVLRNSITDIATSGLNTSHADEERKAERGQSSSSSSEDEEDDDI